MIKAVFLDRDGNVNVEPEDEVVDSLDEVELFPNTIPGLKLLKKCSFKLLFITNQIGISQGKLTVNKFHQINNLILKQLKENDIDIEKTYFCPHSPKDNCNCRKPKTGMVDRAAREYNINLQGSYVIGDRDSDMILGKRVGCKTIFVKTGFDKAPEAEPDYIAEDLLDAAKYIQKRLM